MSENDEAAETEELVGDDAEVDFEEPDDLDVDEDDLDAEELDDDDDLEDDVFVAEDDDDEEDEEEEESRPRARKVEDDDDDEEPEDVEADLEAILRNRMAANDDDEDEEEEENAITGVKPADVTSKREDEFVCESCFLVVNRTQFGTAKNKRCPVGDPDCPSLQRVFG